MKPDFTLRAYHKLLLRVLRDEECIIRALQQVQQTYSVKDICRRISLKVNFQTLIGGSDDHASMVA